MSKNHKHDKKTNNVINRTTSETLRLGEADPGLRVLPQTAHPLGARKKIQNSSSSFQITGVSLTKSDYGDDSADDLDESHTDDISRVTDNETPSFSEDSRDTDDHPLIEAPAAPASSPVDDTQQPPAEETRARFKVVKIPSSLPYNRGRWTCFDYLDSNHSQAVYVYVDEKFSKSEVVDSAAIQLASKVQPIDAPTKKKVASGASEFENAAFFLAQAHASSRESGVGNSSKVGGLDVLSDVKVALTSNILESGLIPSNNNIDRKIEQALDAVKSHLMVAVHKEVDYLKTRVSTLEGRVNELEIENSILRVNYLLFKS